jgi:hypothetical protein
MDGFHFKSDLFSHARRPMKALCTILCHRMPLITRQRAERIPLYCLSKLYVNIQPDLTFCTCDPRAGEAQRRERNQRFVFNSIPLTSKAATRASGELNSERCDRIKLMVDIFHMQMIQGNIINSFKEFKSHIGHVQITQAPNRNEPNSLSELNLKFILDDIEYDGVIGCEYKPLRTTAEGLKWVKGVWVLSFEIRKIVRIKTETVEL